MFQGVVRRLGAATVVVVLVGGAVAGDFELPEGFEIREVVSQNLAPDIYSLTLSPRGDLVAAGKGYIRVLKDDDGDGIADRAVEFSASPKDGAMGMWWEGEELFVVGDGGLWRHTDADGDDRSDGPPELIRSLKTGGEHDSHAIRRGPDDWFYLLCGNESRVDSTSAELAASPIRNPIAGALLRFTPDFSRSEVVADGFRNAYDFDFNLDGEILVYDSDNERDVSLPFYEPTRLYHVTPGFHYGWENPQYARTWRMPPHFYDVDRPIALLGRGSPTGVECSTGSSFPDRYRGGLFLADWTFGRVDYAPLRRRGSTYATEPEPFLRSLGTHGFAPTDLAIHPETGDLFISIGGRGTRGAIYRVRYTGEREESAVQTNRVRRSNPTMRHASSLADWLAPAQTGDLPDRLAMLVAIRRFPAPISADDLRETVVANWSSPDRKIRQLVSKTIGDLDREEGLSFFEAVDSATAAVTLAWGLRETAPETSARLSVPVLDDRTVTAEILTDTIRLYQVLVGDLMAEEARGTIWEGYDRRRPSALSPETEADLLRRLAGLFPWWNRTVDFELTRTFAGARSKEPEIMAKVLDFIDEASPPDDDVHYLAVLGRLPVERSESCTNRIAEGLLALDGKVESRGWNRERHWPWRLGEIYAALSDLDPRLDEALLDHPLFGASDHLAFVSTEGFPKGAAARRLAALSRERSDFEWDPAKTALLEHLPPREGGALARELWDVPRLRDAAIRVLAGNPSEEDRERYFNRLHSNQPEVVSVAVQALARLSPPNSIEEWLAVLKALKRIGSESENRRQKEDFVEYLRQSSGFDLESCSAEDWVHALDEVRPGLAQKWEAETAASLGEWQDRLAGIDWKKGREEEGRAVYEVAGCAACHTGGRTLGPDLAGIGKRFSREDLIVAILDPSRDVSSQFQTRVVETHDGDLFQGLVVYEAADSLILQNGPDATHRIDGGEVAANYPSSISIMPTGLLDPLTDTEVADLIAFLISLD